MPELGSEGSLLGATEVEPIESNRYIVIITVLYRQPSEHLQ
jgi:hypothetical protein